ncbi:Vacuolar protein-sorting-associated protein 36 [Coemansia spiralis]|uniref:Vacuolar protein-sorting-associated protein 36 n=2 Tax=Coemansia TaxID=4863 RepID=A0A9W8G5S5_9FUNG|nr:Vacuolar protein-sorting-associated protein 36 [Coemansia umbellata]KAJ2620449.1 Vacuolar protein-sorting-associated protein 36 [Coemansia sp. RSA 1358]KAJ2673622.1 Vacuolar protein-sorting-associated protein 36 [Coemansia spiralis]
MEPVEVAHTLRPLLESGEKILCIQSKVGLYNGHVRDEEHDSGTVYLTSLRLVYVDQQSPREKSMELHLSRIERCSLHSGFLYSSGKISLYLRPTPGRGSGKAPEQMPAQADGRKYAWVSPYGSIGSAAASAATAAAVERLNGHARPHTAPSAGSPDWMCSICENVNKGGEGKCALCGVPRQGDSVPVEVDDALERAIANSMRQHARCPVCTFDNHASMTRCEMCDSELQPQDSSVPLAGNMARAEAVAGEDPSAPCYDAAAGDGDVSNVELIKLSFRAGGSSSFYTTLNETVNSSTWLVVDIDSAADTPGGAAQAGAVQRSTTARERRPTVGGISTLVSAAHETERARDVTLRSAFADLDALTAMANEILGLAEQIATQLNSPAASKLRKRGGSESDEDTAERADAFRQYLLDLGIDSPVTKDTAGAAFHEELARELCDYLENYVSKCGGTVALVDAYCLYNRAREFTLVYPSDFVQACNKFSALDLPLRLREYPSGLLAIEDPGSASDALIIGRIKRYIQSFGPVTANDLAALEDCPLTLAEERLWVCERAAQVCRDESVEGVRFYSNVFVDSASGSTGDNARPDDSDRQWHFI